MAFKVSCSSLFPLPTQKQKKTTEIEIIIKSALRGHYAIEIEWLELWVGAAYKTDKSPTQKGPEATLICLFNGFCKYFQPFLANAIWKGYFSAGIHDWKLRF